MLSTKELQLSGIKNVGCELMVKDWMQQLRVETFINNISVTRGK